MSVKALPERPPMAEGDEESFPDDIAAISARLSALEDEEKLWNTYIKDLSDLEDPAAGLFYAAELHTARQYRMVLRYRSDFCKARLKRLNGFM